MNLTKIAGVVAIVAICWTISSCSTAVRYTNTGTLEPAKKHGPPPHAPAHGYRHKQGNTVLVFDSALGVYLVDGRSNYYFHDKRYYRATSSGWEITTHIEGPWKPISTKKLPKGLRNSVQVKNKKNNKKKK
jgi:hypothetical protein